MNYHTWNENDPEATRLLHTIVEFSDEVGMESSAVIRRLTASVERSLMAERLRGRFDERRKRK